MSLNKKNLKKCVSLVLAWKRISSKLTRCQNKKNILEAKIQSPKKRLKTNKKTLSLHLNPNQNQSFLI
jgi:hypothetical protein